MSSKDAPKRQRSESSRFADDAPCPRLICTCNKVPQSRIEEVIRRGCRTLPKIFAATTAGVGQCGGSCRPTLQKMLDAFLETGEFPENPLRKTPSDDE